MGTVVMVHRGAAAFAPENTLEAYAAALDYGADGCEVDLRRTADGVLVLFHDDMRAALADVMSWGLHDVFRAHHPEGRVYSWWDYRQLSFPKGDGLRIDYVFANAALADKCRSSTIDRDERKGKQPSDHAPVVVEVEP